MTLNRYDNLAVHVGVASHGRYSAGTFPRTDCSQPRTSRQEGLTLPTEWDRLAGYLACTVPVAFCSGLVGLAVSPLFEVAVPRWLILAYGGGCTLVALLAPLLTRPWQQPSHRKGADANRDRAATWNGPPERDARTPPGAPSASISTL
jgi:hypothetical protein